MTNEKSVSDSQPVLDALSVRVRALRARRGVSRRTLGRLTGISERYLARLESGAANPTIDILWRIAQALDVGLYELTTDRRLLAIEHPGLHELLQQLDADEQAAAHALLQHSLARQHAPYHGVVLVGLRGAGKTTLGRLLAQRLGVAFVRLREIIEQLAGMPLPDVFTFGGQKAYRRLERQAIQHVIDNMPGVLLEVGGSVVSELDTFHRLRSSFFTVWVKASPDEHMNRVIEQGDLRPIQLTDEAYEDLLQILAEREPFYRLSHYALDTTQKSPEQCVDELAVVCRPYLKPVAVA